MSKAYYYVRNFTYPELINVMCYCTKFPHSLTSTQRATRLYRTFLRRQHQVNISEPKADPDIFHREVNQAYRDFKRIIDVPENSDDYVSTMHKYERWVADNIDPTMLFNESRPYAANANKYYIFSDKQLNFDPFGYYKPKNVAGRNPGQGFYWYPDFPQSNNHWVMDTPMSQYDERDYDEAAEYSNSK